MEKYKTNSKVKKNLFQLIICFFCLRNLFSVEIINLAYINVLGSQVILNQICQEDES